METNKNMNSQNTADPNTETKSEIEIAAADKD